MCVCVRAHAHVCLVYLAESMEWRSSQTHLGFDFYTVIIQLSDGEVHTGSIILNFQKVIIDTTRDIIIHIIFSICNNFIDKLKNA